MSVRGFIWILLVFAFGSAPLVPAAGSDVESRFRDALQPLLKRYCFDCHNPEKSKGDLDLTHYKSARAMQDDFKTWQLALQQIEDEEMPPKKPLPEKAERETMLAAVRDVLEAIDWSRHRGIAHLTLPRLSKQEYNNTVRDLLGVDFQPGDLLLDDGQGLSGFTNDRDALFISPALAEQYFDAAEYALQAVLDLGARSTLYDKQAEDMLMTERSARPESLPGGGVGYSLAGAGQRTLYDEVIVPVDGWYRLTVRAVGRGGDSGMRLRIDNEPRGDFYLADEKPGEQTMEILLRSGSHQMTWNIEIPPTLRKQKAEASAPAAKRNASKNAKRTFDQQAAAPRVREAAARNAPRLAVPEGAGKEVTDLVNSLNRNFVSMQMRLEYLRAVTPEGDPANLRSYYNLLPERTQGMVAVKHKLAAAMNVSTKAIDRLLIQQNAARFADNDRVLAGSLAALGMRHDPDFLIGNASPVLPVKVGSPGVDWVRIEGPVLPAQARRDVAGALFKADANQALADFLPRAFRRPLHDGELDRHLRLYEKVRQRGEPHEQALKLAFAAALTSPNFLFRDEINPGGLAFTLNDHQLASRLSYFLWMSMPDDELRQLADAGKLHDDAVLRAQVQRMIRDGRSRAFVQSFLGQWLDFAGLGTEHVPDARKFKEFTPTLAQAMKLEPVLVFEKLLREGGDLAQLIDGRETQVNEELALFYGLKDVKGDALRPVVLPGDARGGLLGMGAVLTASSTPNRTSPVLRGKWVLENLLGRKLPEPPPNAGQLDDKAGDRGKTLREELELHRRDATCAACHDKIDPVGFGLENFDAIGRYRETEAGRPVDASGMLPGGTAFNGPAELRKILSDRHRDEFIANVTRRMAAFALGRALRAQDEGLTRLLLAELKKHGNRADALVEAIVLSEAFRTQGGLER